jgi:hypothetical protein
VKYGIRRRRIEDRCALVCIEQVGPVPGRSPGINGRAARRDGMNLEAVFDEPGKSVPSDESGGPGHKDAIHSE